MEPWIALRNALGVAIPLAVGIAIGMPLGGLAVASGALNVSYSDGHDPYKGRARRMLASSALCAVAVMAGGLVGHHNIAAVALITVWAFGSGMAIALGATGESLAVISLVVLIIYSAQTLTPERAVQAGALAFAGGLMQMVLSLALWPVQAYEPERRALANLYLTLGRAASSPAQLMKAPPPAQASTEAQAALAGPRFGSEPRERTIPLAAEPGGTHTAELVHAGAIASAHAAREIRIRVRGNVGTFSGIRGEGDDGDRRVACARCPAED